jgi:hypothetical protein
MRIDIDRMGALQSKLEGWGVSVSCTYGERDSQAEITHEGSLTSPQMQELRETFGIEPDEAGDGGMLERASRDPRLVAALTILLSSPGTVTAQQRNRAQAIVDRAAARITA